MVKYPEKPRKRTKNTEKSFINLGRNNNRSFSKMKSKIGDVDYTASVEDEDFIKVSSQ
jgi:hypothetical protein